MLPGLSDKVGFIPSVRFWFLKNHSRGIGPGLLCQCTPSPQLFRCRSGPSVICSLIFFFSEFILKFYGLVLVIQQYRSEWSECETVLPFTHDEVRSNLLLRIKHPHSSCTLLNHLIPHEEGFRRVGLRVWSDTCTGREAGSACDTVCHSVLVPHVFIDILHSYLIALACYEVYYNHCAALCLRSSQLLCRTGEVSTVLQHLFWFAGFSVSSIPPSSGRDYIGFHWRALPPFP